MVPFSMEDVVSFVNKEILKDSVDLTVEDIKKRNAQHIAQAYHAFLLALGFSNDMFLTNYQALAEDPEPEVEDLIREEDTKIKLFSTLSWLISQIDLDEKHFSYRDLYSPDPERTTHFLGILKNFYLHNKQQEEQDSKIESEVCMLKNRKVQLLEGQQMFNYDDDKMSYLQRIDNATGKLEILEERNNYAVNNVDQFEQASQEAEALFAQELEENNKIEKVIKTVKQISEVKAHVTQLEMHLKKTDEDLLQFKKLRGREQFGAVTQVYNTLKQTQQIPHFRSSIEKCSSEDSEAAREEKNVEKEIRELELEQEAMMENMNSNNNRFNRRKEMKEKELDTLGREISKLSMSEENAEVRQLLVTKQKIIEEMRQCEAVLAEIEETHTNSASRIRDSLEKFAKNLHSDFRSLQDSAVNAPTTAQSA